MNISCELLLENVRKYYDGFSFNGEIKVYNQFFLNSFFDKERFDNCWYNAGQYSFFIKWIKRYGINDPEKYRHLIIPIDFADLDEIKRVKLDSFLYQDGYFTIEKLEEQLIILDYPNYEVANAISKLYAQYIYKIDGFVTVWNDIWHALENHDLKKLINVYNIAIAKLL